MRLLVSQVRKGDMRALGEAISLIENRSPKSPPLLRLIGSAKGRKPDPMPFVVGVTGSTGAGKSTLIAGLVELLHRRGKKVAVVATDPTSPKTGGALLGDRIRMQRVASRPGVFIRSLASRGARGGVARAVKEVIPLFREAGYDFVFIETVGIGQLDYDVTQFADLTILVLTPEGGDEIQLMKAGIFELAGCFVVNKADRPGANRMADILERVGGGKRPVFETVAEDRKGVEEVHRFIVKQKHTSSLRAKQRVRHRVAISDSGISSP